MRAVLDVQRTAVGHDHPETAATLLRLADVGLRSGRLDEAEPHARAALAVLEAAGPRSVLRAEARSVLGGVLAAADRPDEAAPLLHDALAELQQMRAARPSQVAAAAARLRLPAGTPQP